MPTPIPCTTPIPQIRYNIFNEKAFCFENSMLENRIHQNIVKDTLFSFKNIYSLKNIFIPKISNFLKNNIINVNVAKATKLLRRVSVLVNFCILMTKKKSLCNRYKGFFSQKNDTKLSHYEGKTIWNCHIYTIGITMSSKHSTQFLNF